MAIGYLTDNTEESLFQKYFQEDITSDDLLRCDFSNEADYKCKLVVIPKNEYVVLNICDCTIDESGSLNTSPYFDEPINEPFIFIYDNYESTTPQYAFSIETNGYSRVLPVVFSGMDGKLSISGFEGEVLDISIYE